VFPHSFHLEHQKLFLPFKKRRKKGKERYATTTIVWNAEEQAPHQTLMHKRKWRPKPTLANSNAPATQFPVAPPGPQFPAAPSHHYQNTLSHNQTTAQTVQP